MKNTQNVTLKCMLSGYLRKTFMILQVIKHNVIFVMLLDLFQMVFVSQHFNVIYFFVVLVLAPKSSYFSSNPNIAVVWFRKLSLCTVKCSLSTRWCLSEVKGASSSGMLHDGGYMAIAGILLMTCITWKWLSILGVGEYEGYLCLNESICLDMKNQF